MSKLRTAIIGCGRITSAYIPAFKHIGPDIAVPVLALDKDPDRARSFAAHFPACTASDQTDLPAFKNLLQKYRPDLLHILLPHHLHCQYAVAALESGIHVLTEKPIGISADDADRMIAAATKNHKQLGVIFQNRYIDGVQKVRELIENGTMGTVKGAFSTLAWHRPASYYQCDWKGRWQTEGGGVVIDQAIHSIDLVRYMTGMNAVKVRGNIARRILQTIEVEDAADAAITLSNGAIYSFQACNYYTKNSPIRIGIDCEHGSALLTADKMEIEWNDGRLETILPGQSAADSSVPDYWGIFHEKQIRACYDAVIQGAEMPWKPEDAKKTLEIVLAIYLSSQIQGEVVI